MRNLIIDTDTGSDDAVALVMALRDPSVKVAAITTVCGNVNVDQATRNALVSVDYAGTYKPPVFQGMAKPLMRDLEISSLDFGADGMSGGAFRKPSQQAEREHAVNALIRLIGASDGKLELLALGPLTNIAMAMMQAPEVMRKLPGITIMGGANFYTNAHTAMAEYNIYADPEAADVVFRFGLPITLVTLEACMDEGAPLCESEIAHLKTAGEAGAFCVDCNQAGIDMTRHAKGQAELELPDPAAYAVFSKPELAKTSFDSETIIELGGDYSRGTTIFRRRVGFFETVPLQINSRVVTALHGNEFKNFLIGLMEK